MASAMIAQSLLAGTSPDPRHDTMVPKQNNLERRVRAYTVSRTLFVADVSGGARGDGARGAAFSVSARVRGARKARHEHLCGPNLDRGVADNRSVRAQACVGRERRLPGVCLGRERHGEEGEHG